MDESREHFAEEIKAVTERHMLNDLTGMRYLK